MSTRINKLTLQGFKSFRKKVSIPFLEGFNVVAGPNGSGKSNILDAVSFVLGKSSTKSMRADRLHELIYHGNKKIPASEYASVSLWLDNSDKIFPFEDSEITILRKVNKKGTSVYKINGRTTTREKVLELLSSARIHPDGFNMIMQGDVTQVIEMSSEERREILDQVAGIALYDEKKQKAQKNLEIVGEKIREVEIILTERLERLQTLEQDRNTAIKYKELIEQLKLLSASLAHRKYKSEKKRYDSIDDEINQNDAFIQKLEKDVKRAEKEIESEEKKRQEITEKLFIRSKEAGIRQEIEDIKNKIIRNKDRIESDEREIERISKMIDKLRAVQASSGFFSKAIKTILDLRKPRVHGTVSSLIKTPSDYRIAAEVAGGSRFWNIVVSDANTAAECISFLKRERIGRATFLPLSRIKSRELTDQQKKFLKKPGVIGLLSNLVKYDYKYSPVVKYIFGNTLVVENLSVARQLGIGKVRMVTLDGDLVERSGAMIGGYYKKRQETTSDIELEEYEQVKQDLEEEINFMRIEIGQLNEKTDKLREKYEKESQSVLDLGEERTSVDEKITLMKQQRNELFEERARILDKTNKLKIRGARTEAEISSLKLEVDRYGEFEYLDEKVDVLEDKISQTTSELNSLGLVNMKAIEEYDKFKGEFDELKNKYDQIRDERDAILGMIEKIEGKKKEVFYECLRSIDKNFREIFRDLAHGDSSLQLEDPLNIQGGLIIQANPSGKNLLNIDAMSGGEKTLTALAFLFAIQRYKPAPFYILDEIDAALDKANTKKVAELIKKMSKKEQFIVITHNDYTVKKGDRVYGVTMSNSESQILGIELPGIKAG
ncbi:MAG: chromosome segregation protein SMC [Candidatus Aenigmarchaeota archaeon]|nr:chromosome segregation protein SMC [Candidatus Aenigmarchaeota archaeon]